MVFARIATLAPSLAHFLAMARPIPLDPPVTTIVFPLKGLIYCFDDEILSSKRQSLFILVWIFYYKIKTENL